MKNLKLYKYKKRKIIKQYLFRYSFFKIEYFYLLLKIILKNIYISRQLKVLGIFYLIFFLNISFIVKQKNICLLEGNSRSVSLKTGLSRSKFRAELGKTTLPGYQGARW